MLISVILTSIIFVLWWSLRCLKIKIQIRSVPITILTSLKLLVGKLRYVFFSTCKLLRRNLIIEIPLVLPGRSLVAIAADRFALEDQLVGVDRLILLVPANVNGKVRWALVIADDTPGEEAPANVDGTAWSFYQSELVHLNPAVCLEHDRMCLVLLFSDIDMGYPVGPHVLGCQW